MLAHIVGGGPSWPLWITSALLFGGLVGATSRRTALRRTSLVVSAIGLVTTVLVYVTLPAAPAAPSGVSLRIATPTAGAVVTDPVVVRVCGGGAALPGSGRLLSYSVDGSQVLETRNAVAALSMAPGRHTIRVELVTSSHREFAPPVLTQEDVSAAGYAAPTAPPPC